jgi:hypothetical protein
MAKEKSKSSTVKTTSNSKQSFGRSSNRKRTSIGNSKRSRPKNKYAVRQRKGR